MTVITWRNVNATGLNSAAESVGNAGETIAGGLDRIADSVEGITDIRDTQMDRRLNETLQSYKEGIESNFNVFKDSVKSAEANPYILNVNPQNGEVLVAKDADILKGLGFSNGNSPEAQAALSVEKDKLQGLIQGLTDQKNKIPSLKNQNNYIARLAQSAGRGNDIVSDLQSRYGTDPSATKALSEKDLAEIALKENQLNLEKELIGKQAEQAIAQQRQLQAPWQVFQDTYGSQNADDAFRSFIGNKFNIEDETWFFGDDKEDVGQYINSLKSGIQQAVSESPAAIKAAREAGLWKGSDDNGTLILDGPTMAALTEKLSISSLNDLPGVGSASERTTLRGAFVNALKLKDNFNKAQNSINQIELNTISNMAKKDQESIKFGYSTSQASKDAQAAIGSGFNSFNMKQAK